MVQHGAMRVWSEEEEEEKEEEEKAAAQDEVPHHLARPE